MFLTEFQINKILAINLVENVHHKIVVYALTVNGMNIKMHWCIYRFFIYNKQNINL